MPVKDPVIQYHPAGDALPHPLPVPEGEQDLLLFVADIFQHRDLCVKHRASWHAGFSLLICPLPSHGWPARFTVVYMGLPSI